jgi:2',3'-cyclic-nucleotide 2'-phosphodiesterase (5'-nucleotidase family)
MTSSRVRLAAASRLALVLSGMVLGTSGCTREAERPGSAPEKTPSVRFYVVANLAGAIEPCGCVKDMLGGIDHAAALVNSSRTRAPHSLFVGAGPTFFMDPTIEPESRAQDIWKAEALAESLRELRFTGWAPGINDWAAGGDKLSERRTKSGAHLLGANVHASGQPFEAAVIVETGGFKVGFAGVAVPEYAGQMPEGVRIDPPAPKLAEARAKLDALGAQIRVALVAMPRGQAIRLAEEVSGFDLVVVGKPFQSGEANDDPTPPVLVNGALVVQPPNHLQTVAVVDFFVRSRDFDFRDGSGIANVERKDSLERRARELEQRIKEWEHQGTSIKKADVDARRADLRRVREELASVSKPPAPPSGSFFTYEQHQIRERLGSDPRVAGRLQGYYRRVNEHNRVAFKDRTPAPVPEGQSGYLGVEACSACHVKEREFWNGTRHPKAYATLADQHKQFNLDCVGCHVTGYDKPGGSTVTHVQNLENVQCETCHGPGSRHLNDPKNPALIKKTPARDLCASQCHHPPHVHADWNVDEAWKHIIGPGHGAPD